MKELILENWQSIIAILGVLYSGGLILKVRSFIKETKELIDTVNQAKKDKIITEKEKDLIIQELSEVLESAYGLYILFKSVKKKEKK